jgi:diguanylate cyclase (GGDEF)-like protein/PAS domain S-box-containing protein
MNEVTSAKPKILIVDDVAENLHTMMNILRDDYAIVAATNGEKALQLAACSPPPELILLDIQMPGMDGYEVLRRLKAYPAMAAIPVIFVSALTDETNEAQGLDLGAVDYITKPANPAITRLRVRHQIALKNAQREVRENEEMLRAITDAVQSAVVLIDDQEIIQFANPAAEKLFGYGHDELKGQRVHQILIPELMGHQARKGFNDFVHKGEGPVLDKPLELVAQRKDNSKVFIELYIGRIRRGDSWWVVGAAVDISKHKQREATLVDQVGTDPLTGVRNRRSFMGLAEEMLKDRRLEGEGQQLYILMFDLDHFKRINDSYGHMTGDQVLRTFANLCVKNLRDTDLFARIGGEEFAAVVRSRDLHSVTNVAERIRLAYSCGTRVEVDGKALDLETSVSIGLVQFDPRRESLENGLKRADAALYRAKSQGRNRLISG